MPKRDLLDMAEIRYQANELKLTMDNEGTIYPELQRLRMHVIKDSCDGGRVRESTMAAAFMPVVRREATKYKRQFGEGFTEAAMREAAREYVRQTKRWMNHCARNAEHCGDLPDGARKVIHGGSCKVPPGGFAGARRARKRR
jgi:hypothetical protein